ncbi:MAG: hypothetical protein IKE28_00110 [Solobacterium sp.]|nr:hypothetical protein [Solobacterium sp.]
MIIFLAVALFILSIGVSIAWRNRNDLQKMSLSMTISISFAISALALPYFMNKNSHLLYALLAALKYGTSAIGMSVNEDILYSLNLSGPIFHAYNFLLSLLYIAGPVFASMFIIGFSRSLVEFLRFGKYRHVHVFSELNERSAMIAESLYKRNPKELRVFCTSRNASDALKARANKNHSFLVQFDEASMKIRKNRTYEFYEIYDDPDKTLPKTAELARHLRDQNSDHAVVRVFINHSHLELVREFDTQFGSDNTALQIRYIDENGAEATELFHHMIQSLPIGIPDYHYQFLLIGCGETGGSILRTAASLLILPESRTKFHVVDRNARQIAARFKSEAPEFLNADLDAYFSDDPTGKNYDITFHNLDAQSSELGELLQKIGRPDLTVVSISDDLENHRIAKQILRILSSESDQLDSPLIAARIRNSRSLDLLEKDSKLWFFGSMEKHYSYDSLVHPQLEEAAKQVHMAYCREDQWTPELEETFYRYVNNDSSFAQALAMMARCRYILFSKPEGVPNREWIDSVINDPEKLAVLGTAEHNRWNAYQRINGWRKATLAQVDVIAKRTGGRKVKDDVLLLHPAIVTYSQLEEVEREVDRIRRKYNPEASSVDYINSDRVIIRCLPKILQSESVYDNTL